MQNTESLTPAQRAFANDMGQHMVGWGLPRTTGRVYAYLLLQDAPVDLDRICSALEVARSAASVATRQLVHFGMARAMGVRGTRRLVYEALHGLEAMFSARNAQTLALIQQFQHGVRAAPPGAVQERLTQMATTLQRFLDEVPALLARMRDGEDT